MIKQQVLIVNEIVEIEWYVDCQQEAEKISSALLDQKLVACINFLKISSMYIFQGQLEKHSEIKVSFKTFFSKIEEIEKYIEIYSSYDVPAIVSKKVVRVNSSFALWMSDYIK